MLRRQILASSGMPDWIFSNINAFPVFHSFHNFIRNLSSKVCGIDAKIRKMRCKFINICRKCDSNWIDVLNKNVKRRHNWKFWDTIINFYCFCFSHIFWKNELNQTNKRSFFLIRIKVCFFYWILFCFSLDSEK